MRGTTATLVLAACLVLAPGAGAATVSAPPPDEEGGGTGVTVDRGNAEDNDLLLKQGKDHKTVVRERGDAPLRAEGACDQASERRVVCPYSGTLTLDLGTGSDVATMQLRGLETVKADGGDGDDVIAVAGLHELSHVTLRGGRGGDTLRGAAGRDLIFGGAGPDVLSGRHGSDVLFGDGERSSAGHDEISGGSGFDYAKWSDRRAPVRVDLRGGGSGGTAGEDDALSSIEAAVGGKEGDVLIGDGGRNLLRGGPGPDLMRGLGGDDSLQGGSGPDRLSGGAGDDGIDTGSDNDDPDPDSDADKVKCADGRDTVFGANDDRPHSDLIPQSCERVIAVYVVAVPRLRLGAERVMVEVRCNPEGGNRQVRLVSRGVELGRGQVGFCDHHGQEVEVPLDEPLAAGPPIRVLIDGENTVFPGPRQEPFHASYRLSRPDA